MLLVHSADRLNRFGILLLLFCAASPEHLQCKYAFSTLQCLCKCMAACRVIAFSCNPKLAVHTSYAL